jgi:hypothetical protein
LSAGELLERLGGRVAAVGDLGVRAEHEQELRVLRVGMQERRGGRVEHPLVEEVVLRLLLRERVEPAPRARAAEERHRVGGVHVVPLPADADERDRARRVARADVDEPRRDLRDRGVPVDLLERAVRPAPHRVAHAVAVLDVVVDLEGLVADVALRDRIRLVGAHLDDAAVHHVDEEPAVVAAEHAHGRQVRAIRFRHVRSSM